MNDDNGIASPANDQLRAVLAEVGWGPEALARRIADHARQQRLKVSVHEKTPYSWIRDGRCPHDPIPQLACVVLAEQLGRNLTPADLGWQPKRDGMRRADDGLAELWLPEGAILGLGEVVSRMHRRGFLVLTGSALTAVAHQWMVAEPGRLLAGLEGQRIDEQLIADIERIVDARRRMDDALGGGALYETVIADLRLVVHLLRDATYTEALGCRLYAMAAELARLAGWACHDTGYEGAAQRYWLVALRAAHEAQDKALGANVLTFMGLQSRVASNPQDAITIFASAKHAGGSALGATQQAAIAGLMACAHARAGDAHTTAASVDEAFTLLERSKPEGDPPWIYWCDTAEISGDAGFAFLHLGDPTRAVPHLETAVNALDVSCSRDRVLWMSTLATAQLRAGDADQALATAHEAVDIATRLSSDRMRDVLSGFCREVTDTVGNPASVEFVEHARAALKA